MPATTGKGYPYPLGTDRLMDGDDAIKALAEAVDVRLGVAAGGIASVPVAAGQAASSVAITFPVGRFSYLPVVVGTYSGTNVAWSLVQMTNVTASGCTVGVSHRDGTASGSATTISVYWHATQLP